MLSREQIASIYVDSCRAEIDALKPGNVHRFADGHHMTAQQFLESAEITAAPITFPDASVGERVLASASITREKVGTNTNLGILLLCAPLAKAAEIASLDLRQSLQDVIGAMDDRDTRDVFAAIRLANPGGLGKSETNDVNDEPVGSLVEAMRQAEHRDSVARQYATGFADIFAGGLSAHAKALADGETGMWPTVFVYLQMLSTFPDSHIARKHGLVIAEEVRGQAEDIFREIARTSDTKARERTLLAFDSRLKASGLNPGTSADLTVATLFAAGVNFALQCANVNA
ncbi:triphosphoribosyl-dephospho-CoA synthase [Sinorhizobium sp. BG8]|uniref:triphosphoribosyl-dephospho-CoA synthase n=1 Tax=Sinorhizobium sp. BG8 TaxID=2613773 RepID=UPI00193D82F3|nr:triphosphoribosyl-dephospho-CoA synthase [Sinorhizobium sp. BG8]